MPKVYQVDSVEEAVKLAWQFKDEGKYDWFRGQTRGWPPHSSLYRAKGNSELISKEEFKFYRFLEWVQSKNELKHLLEPDNRHQLEAILQHYGFPTDYIDFTTDPSIAGFFASDTKSPPIEGFSCIYCLNTEDLLSIWNDIKDFESRKGAQIEKVVVDVSNLWRLEAQKGVFLLANYNWEIDYPLDKIIFPYTDYPSYPTKDIIYPEHKSALETLLDEFFDRQRSLENFIEVAPYFDEIHAITPFPEGFHKEAFKEPTKIKSLPSWNDEALKPWKGYKIEDYHSTVGISQKLSLRGKVSEKEIKNIIDYGILQVLRSNGSIRTKAVNWVLAEAATDMDTQRMSLMLSKIWNGMRLLPFTNEEISTACGNLIYLHMKQVRTLSGNEQLHVFTELFGECSRVGFSIQEGNGSNSFASNQSIVNSFGVNFSDLLVDKLKEISNKPKDLFRVIYNPRIMFDFNKFKTVFARELIPSQLSLYEPYVIYNPADIVLFGNP